MGKSRCPRPTSHPTIDLGCSLIFSLFASNLPPSRIVTNGKYMKRREIPDVQHQQVKRERKYAGEQANPHLVLRKKC
jgi:hypothetical protein